MINEDPRPPHTSLPRLFLIFLRFGSLAFGGPIAQIAMVRQELVERRGWISGPRFNRLLAVMQALPGPEAHELCVHLGMRARGRIGGLIAGLGFMAPGVVLMMALAWFYVRLDADAGALRPALLGAQAAVLALIARAVVRIARHAITGQGLLVVALFAFFATLGSAPFWIVLPAAGLASLWFVQGRPLWGGLVLAIAGAACAGLALLPATAVAETPTVVAGSIAALFLAGLKGGLLTFGGAYTAIPFVRRDVVGPGGLNDGAFLDGVALAHVVPAPLVVFATFAGYVVGGPLGALAITAGIFLPAFAFSLLLYERLEAVVEAPRLKALLDGVAAAVVGVIAATLISLGVGLWGPMTRTVVLLAIAALSLMAAFTIRRSWAPPAILALGGLAGWLLL